MGRIFKFFHKREWIFSILSIILIGAQVYLDLKVPEEMQEITTILQKGTIDTAAILTHGGFMLLWAVLSAGAAILTGLMASVISSIVAMRMREALFAKTMDFSLEEIGRFSTSSLIMRCTNDINFIQLFIAYGVQILIKSPILAVFALIKIIKFNQPTWTLITGLCIGGIVALCLIIVFVVMPKANRVPKLNDKVTSVTREHLNGLRVIHSYNAYGYQKERFEKANTVLTKTNLFYGKGFAILLPGINVFMNLLSLLIYASGSTIIIGLGQGSGAQEAFSQMVVFSSYALQVVSAFLLLILVLVLSPRAIVSANRIKEVLDTTPSIRDGVGTEGKTLEKGKIEFKNVSFRYPNAKEDAVKNITFTAEKGQTVAFIGATGSGKTSLLNLIPRFYDVTSGEILVDGVNVKDYKIKELRNILGYVPQKSMLFRGNIFGNIDYGDNGKMAKTLDQIKRATEIGQAKEFIEKKDGGYEARVEQGGSNFSGGQKQRLTISRAIARDPEIFIFDDSFSALDFKTDRVLRDTLRKEAGDATMLIVAQRIGTIMNADKIIVLENGEMVGMGKHSELIKNCPIYQEIALSQLSKEEA